MSNFKLPDELLDGAVKVIRPTDLRNRVGLYMMEERGVQMGRNVDPGDVQDMIVEFTQREIEKLSTGEANGWISVEERFPPMVEHWSDKGGAEKYESSDQFMFIDENGDYFIGEYAGQVGEDYRWSAYGGGLIQTRVTHWQPLKPPAPTSVPQAEPKGEQ